MLLDCALGLRVGSKMPPLCLDGLPDRLPPRSSSSVGSHPRATFLSCSRFLRTFSSSLLFKNWTRLSCCSACIRRAVGEGEMGRLRPEDVVAEGVQVDEVLKKDGKRAS